MLEIPLLLLAVIGIALIFDFTNGVHDSANAIATVVSTKVLSPLAAVLMAGVLNLLGAFLGTAVAHTIGSDIVRPELVTGSQALVLAALLGAISWNILTWYWGLPSSSSHGASPWPDGLLSREAEAKVFGESLSRGKRIRRQGARRKTLQAEATAQPPVPALLPWVSASSSSRWPCWP